MKSGAGHDADTTRDTVLSDNPQLGPVQLTRFEDMRQDPHSPQ
jgi:hypothetical protein